MDLEKGHRLLFIVKNCIVPVGFQEIQSAIAIYSYRYKKIIIPFFESGQVPGPLILEKTRFLRDL